MGRDSAIEKIRAIVEKYISAQDLEVGVPLTAKPYYVSPRSLAAIFLDIEQEFEVDLDKVFDQPLDYSINTMADAIVAQF